ncbi:MAG: phage tail tape measure protein [Candidatus Hodarchaeota archaeon]
MTVGELKIILTATTAGLTASLGVAKSSLMSFGSSVRAMGATVGSHLMTAFRSIGSGISTIFRNLMHIVSNVVRHIRNTLLVMAAGFALVTWSGAQLEDALVRTFSILGKGAKGLEDDFRALTDMALLLGRETLYTATQAAEGMKILALAGFTTTEILNTIPGVLNLAIAAGTGLNETATIVIATLKSFQIETEDTETVTNLMTAAFTNANMVLMDLGESLKYVAAISAAAFGPGIETMKDMTAAVMILSNAGLQGSMAGTQLRMMIQKMLRPTGQAVRILSRLGYTFLDASSGASKYGHILVKSEQQLGTLTDELINTRMKLLELTNAGQTGTAEFSALSDKLSELQTKETLLTQNMEEARKEFEITGGKLKPLRQIIPELIDLQLNAAQVSTLFGVRAGIAASIFASSGKDAFNEYLNMLEKVQKNQDNWANLTDKISQMFRTTVKGRFADIKATLVNIAWTIFESYKQKLADTMFAIRNWLNEVNEVFRDKRLIDAFVNGLGEGLTKAKELLFGYTEKFRNWLEKLDAEEVKAVGKRIGEAFSSFIEYMRDLVTTVLPSAINLIKELSEKLGQIDWAALTKGAVEAFTKVINMITKASELWEKSPFFRITTKAAVGALAGGKVAGPLGAAVGGMGGLGLGIGQEINRTPFAKALERWSTRQEIEQQLLSEYRSAGKKPGTEEFYAERKSRWDAYAKSISGLAPKVATAGEGLTRETELTIEQMLENTQAVLNRLENLEGKMSSARDKLKKPKEDSRKGKYIGAALY